jgi:hypothetical protein
MKNDILPRQAWDKRTESSLKRRIHTAKGPERRPFMAYIGPKACHDPFQPAPWYKDTWEAGWPAHAPHPPSYNISQEQLSEHHPTISCRAPFGNQTETCIDQNFKDRWRTLLSVTRKLPSFHHNVSLRFVPSLSWQNIAAQRTQKHQPSVSIESAGG